MDGAMRVVDLIGEGEVVDIGSAEVGGAGTMTTTATKSPGARPNR